ncbi:MAG: DUF2252 family protein [Polyangiales bacterium]
MNRLSCVVAFALLGCASTSAPRGSREEAATLQLIQAQLTAGGATPELLQRLAANRMRFFRMLAEWFEQRTCAAFHDVRSDLPTTAVQGDAHIEQFVVTHTTFGLEDFDRAGYGPAVIDLVRYSASLHIACRDVTWPCDANKAVAEFLDAYRAALLVAPPVLEPAVVARLRAKAPTTLDWLERVDRLMHPMPSAVARDVVSSWQAFANGHPEWPEGASRIVRMGALHLGVGSALERKFLLRIEGPTEQPDDDVVIEAREGSPPSPVKCVKRGGGSELLALLFMQVIGRRLPDVHGLTMMFGLNRTFWLQSWDPGYVELSVRDIANQTELGELAVDAAAQLASAARTPGLDRKGRRPKVADQIRAFDRTRARIVTLAFELADESDTLWKRFRAGLAETKTAAVVSHSGGTKVR